MALTVVSTETVLGTVVIRDADGTTHPQEIWRPQPLALSGTRFVIKAEYVNSTPELLERIYVLDETGTVLTTTDLPFMESANSAMLKISSTDFIEVTSTARSGGVQAIEARRITLVNDVPTVVTYLSTPDYPAGNITGLGYNLEGPALCGSLALIPSSYSRYSSGLPDEGNGFGILAIDINTCAPVWVKKIPLTAPITSRWANIFVHGTEVTLYGLSMDSSWNETLSRWKLAISSTSGDITEGPTVMDTWNVHTQRNSEPVAYGNPYLAPEARTEYAYAATGNVASFDLYVGSSTPISATGADGFQYCDLEQYPWGQRTDNPFMSAANRMYMIAGPGGASHQELGFRVWVADQTAGTFEITPQLIPTVNGVQGDPATWAYWDETNGGSINVSFDPVTGLGLATCGWVSQQDYATSPRYLSAHAWVVQGPAGTPAEPAVRPLGQSLLEGGRSAASGRLTLRMVSGAPIESVLNETPGNIGVTVPPPTPILQVAIYPGERTETVPSRPYTPTGFQFPQDPGLVQTHRGLPRQAQLSVLADTLCSTSGEFLSSARQRPEEVRLGTEARWLPQDFAAGRWGAFTGSVQPWSWTGTPESITLAYRRGKENFAFPALSFDPGDFLTSDFGIGEVNELTLSGVVMLRLPLEYTVFSAGEGDQDWKVVASPNIRLETLARKVYSRRPLAASTATPLFFTAVVKPPVTTVYISSGPGFTTAMSVRHLEAAPVALKMLIGKHQGEDALANMELLEVSVDTYARTGSEVQELNAAYGSIYGSGLV